MITIISVALVRSSIADESQGLMQATRGFQAKLTSPFALGEVGFLGEVEVKTCQEKYEDAVDNMMVCFQPAIDGTASFQKFVEEQHSIDADAFKERFKQVAEMQALEMEDCTSEEIGFEAEDVDRIRHTGRLAATKLIQERVEQLEYPTTVKASWKALGRPDYVKNYEAHVQTLDAICQTNASHLSQAEPQCHEHLQIDLFIDSLLEDFPTDLCNSEALGLALSEVHKKRLPGEQQRAKLIQVLHTSENRLSHHYMKHLKHGGSSNKMDFLIRYEASKANLTMTQRARLKRLDASVADKRNAMCMQKPDDHAKEHSIIYKNAVYQSYIDCLCNSDELSLICEANLLQGAATIAEDIRNHQQKQQLVQSSEDTSKGNSSSSGLPAGIGPCILAPALNCEVCLQNHCIGGDPRKGGALLDGSIKNVLTAKVGDLKINCVLCASLQPGEQLSFEIEASLSANLNGLSSLFTSTEIGIQASTCIGPGSPLRVAFDTLGFPACKANLWAKYKPFIGEFDVGGSIPAFHGMFLQAEFGMPVHDPVGAVTSYCQGQGLLQTSAADKLQIANDSMPEMPFDTNADNSMPTSQEAEDDEMPIDESADHTMGLIQESAEQAMGSSTVIGVAWEGIGGALKVVSVGGNGHVWGVNSGDNIYFRNGKNGGWVHIGGYLTHVDVSGSAGQYVWGVNSADNIWFRAGQHGTWQQVGGALKQISVAKNGEVWGVNNANDIFWRNGYGGSWVHIGGKLKYVSVGGNAGQYVWGVNSNDDIFFRSGRGGTWQGVGGKLKQVEVGDDGWVWGVNVHNQIWTRNGLGGPWQHVAGVLKHVSVGLAIWGVNSADSIFVATNPNSVAGGAVPYTGSRNVGNWQTCYNNFKAAAGNLEFGAGVTVPLLWGGDFWIAKISGPHASGSKWKVEVFQIPFDQIAAAVKEVWDNTIVPAFEDAGDAIGSAASDVGDWTSGAAEDVGAWTSGAAEDVGAWTSGAAEDVGQALCFWC